LPKNPLVSPLGRGFLFQDGVGSVFFRTFAQ